MTYDNDYELVSKFHEGYEEASTILYKKYHYIVETILKRYAKISYALGLDYSDIYQEALFSFTNAIANYRDESNSSLSSFITLCVDRKIRNTLTKANRRKNKHFKKTLSLEETYGECDQPLMDFISDNNESEPLSNILQSEFLTTIETNVKAVLSSSEYKVYILLKKGHKYRDISTILHKDRKQIDNTMQRIRNKIKKYVDIEMEKV